MLFALFPFVLFLLNVALSWGWGASLLNFVVSFCVTFSFVSHFHVTFVCFGVSWLYGLSHHIQGRVHDGDPMGGHDSDSVVGPG